MALTRQFRSQRLRGPPGGEGWRNRAKIATVYEAGLDLQKIHHRGGRALEGGGWCGRDEADRLWDGADHPLFQRRQRNPRPTTTKEVSGCSPRRGGIRPLEQTFGVIRVGAAGENGPGASRGRTVHGLRTSAAETGIGPSPGERGGASCGAVGARGGAARQRTIASGRGSSVDAMGSSSPPRRARQGGTLLTPHMVDRVEPWPEGRRVRQGYPGGAAGGTGHPVQAATPPDGTRHGSRGGGLLVGERGSRGGRRATGLAGERRVRRRIFFCPAARRLFTGYSLVFRASSASRRATRGRPGGVGQSPAPQGNEY